jgi:hypothetical protein
MRATAFQVFRNVRAFFAPVDRATGTPAAFDPASAATFDLDAPPAPWLSLGEVRAFHRTSATAQTPLRAGGKGAVASQVRSLLDARVDFDFWQWGKLQMALAGGSGQTNVIAQVNGAPVAPLAILAGSTATALKLSSADGATLHAGDLIAADIHYAGQTGYIGSGISAALVSPGQTSDRDFIRRVTFNVARVRSISSGTVTLDQPLPGGAPAGNAFVQKITAFTDREAGTFFHEWSAIFFLVGDSGGNICFYYPRLQPCAPAAEAAYALDESNTTNRVPHSFLVSGRVGTSAPGLEHSGDALSLATLHASFIALPVTDLIDNDQVLCYRTYIPAANASLY